MGYTGEVGEPVSSCGGGAPNTAWWKWTAPGSGNVTIDTFGSRFDTVLAVYTGSSVAGLTEVVCNDDTSGRSPQVTFACDRRDDVSDSGRRLQHLDGCNHLAHRRYVRFDLQRSAGDGRPEPRWQDHGR